MPRRVDNSRLGSSHGGHADELLDGAGVDGEVGQPEEVGPDDHGPEGVPRERVGVEAATIHLWLTIHVITRRNSS